MADKPEQPEKMDLRSMDIRADNRARLKQLFPSVFTETVNENGDLVESIDVEKLKAELGTFSDLFESRRERYGMDWPGKKDAMKLIQQPSVGTLKPCRDESVNFDGTQHLFIEGDNLEVLKLLQKSYYGKVKVICIDPPYNTGKEFIYPDNYAETLGTYLSYAGLADDQGRKFSTNTPTEGRFHTRWLNMMYPRLYLARNLLRDDGVIFIHIDDNEVSNLRKLCDEIFGEENFAAQFVWQARQSIQNDTDISESHEHIISYAKNRRHENRRLKESNFNNWFKDKSFAFYPKALDENKFSNPDNDPRGKWKADPFDAPNIRPNLTYEIVNPKTEEKHLPPSGRCWRTSEDEYKKLLADNRILFGKTGVSRPQLKVFYHEKKDFGSTVDTWLDGNVFGTATKGTKTIQNLFDGSSPFDTVKPVELPQKLFQITTSPAPRGFSSDPDIILDFFAGSCTTAHAVLDLNKEDGGNRKFIMVQLPEPCDENSEAFKAGYNTIADIGKERIRRVIKKIEAEQAAAEKDAASNLPGMAAETPTRLDLGFKVFKLDQSNFKLWDGADPDISEEKLARQLELFVDHINPKASPEDVLYELLLKAGFKLTETVVKKTMAGKTVFSIADGALLICLENEITRELIDAVAEAEPIQFICLDRAFNKNDQLKANAVQTFEARNQGRDKAQQIVFRTV